MTGRAKGWGSEARPAVRPTPEAVPGGCGSCAALQLQRHDGRYGHYVAVLHRPSCPELWAGRGQTSAGAP